VNTGHGRVNDTVAAPYDKAKELAGTAVEKAQGAADTTTKSLASAILGSLGLATHMTSTAYDKAKEVVSIKWCGSISLQSSDCSL